MRTRPLLALLLLAVLAAPLPVLAGPSARVVLDAVEDGIAYGDLGPAAPPEVALARVADVLGVDAGEFTFDHHRTSLIGVHHRGVQVVDGIPVEGTAAAVHVVGGRVVKVHARATDAVGVPVARPVGATVAEAAALATLGAATPLAVDVTRLLVPTDGSLVDTYRVTVLAPTVAASVDVAAADGAVLRTFDDRRFADAPPSARPADAPPSARLADAPPSARLADAPSSARLADATATLFDPNPIATSGHLDMAQDVDIAGVDVDHTTDARVTEELVDLPIVAFDEVRAAAGNLLGPWVDVLGAGPFVPVAGRFDVSKTDPRFEGLMGYHHIDAIQRYFQAELGMDNINAEPQTFIALPVMGFDNSFYMDGPDLILVGAGGVDDGEDAEVIIHELGHAIHYDQVPGWGRSPEGGAMGEGFGDFLAASYYATFEGTVRSQDTCLMEWDATSYSSAEQTCLRRTDTAKTYADKVGQVHADGEIWSKYLWNVRARLGEDEVERSRNVLRLLLTAHFSMSDQADFAEAIGELLRVARTVGADAVVTDAETSEAWVEVLLEEAEAMGMPVPQGHVE